MKFYELLKKYPDNQILESLHKNYNNIVNRKYLSALKELRKLKPSNNIQETALCVEFVRDDVDEDDKTLYLDCNGIGPDKNGKIIRWGVEYDSWDEWLAQDIYKETLENLDELTILAGIIYGLTSNGYTQIDAKNKKKELLRRINKLQHK